WSTTTTGTLTSTTTTATGVSGFGDFAVGQQVINPPTVTGISPSSGPTGGGTTVTVDGTNLSGATAVKFGSVAGTGVSWSATSSTVTSPATITPATVDVTVTTAGGTSVVSLADQFTYNAVTPTVTSLGTSNGPTAGGTSVTITGTGFTTGSTVSFGGVAGTGVNVTSSTSISVTSPAQAAGPVDVTVTNTAGTPSPGPGDGFTDRAPPTRAPRSPRP